LTVCGLSGIFTFPQRRPPTSALLPYTTLFRSDPRPGKSDYRGRPERRNSLDRHLDLCAKHAQPRPELVACRHQQPKLRPVAVELAGRAYRFDRRVGVGALLLALVLFLAACEGPKKEPEEEKAALEGLRLVPAEFKDLPGWEEDRLVEALPALNRSCQRLLTQPDERPLGPDGLAGTVADWREPCGDLASLDRK